MGRGIHWWFKLKKNKAENEFDEPYNVAKPRQALEASSYMNTLEILRAGRCLKLKSW
jgi:hypothetical protein